MLDWAERGETDGVEWELFVFTTYSAADFLHPLATSNTIIL